MAGNKNSGRHGKSLPDMIQSACRRALKQGEAGLAGQRSLSVLLAEQMQTDPLGFLRAVAPYCPKEILVDHQISISSALQEARSRVIEGQATRVLEECSRPEPIDLMLTEQVLLDED